MTKYNDTVSDGMTQALFDLGTNTGFLKTIIGSPDDKEETTLDYTEVMTLVQKGFRKWECSPSNKKWAKRLKGTPAKNDIVVCITREIVKSIKGEVKDSDISKLCK